MKLDKWGYRLSRSVFFATVFTACQKTELVVNENHSASDERIEYLDIYMGGRLRKNARITTDFIPKKHSVQMLSWLRNKKIQEFVNNNKDLLLIDIPNDTWMGCIGEPDPQADISFDSIKFEG